MSSAGGGEGYPFPADRLALARLDFCLDPSTVLLDASQDALTCTLRARQCGSHVVASEDADWNRRAMPSIYELVGAPRVDRWGGTPTCARTQVSGVCSLLATEDAFRDSLWNRVGRPREVALYQSVQGETPEPLPAVNALGANGFGSKRWMAEHYR